VAAALERAHALRCWSAEGVEQLVHQERDTPLATTTVDLAAVPALAHLAHVQIPLPDPHGFDRLLEAVCP